MTHAEHGDETMWIHKAIRYKTVTVDGTEVDPNLKPHPWEQCGMGKAPFEYIGTKEEWIKTGDPSNPRLPAGSCDVCGAAIAYQYWIESADGKRFKVGCDCVAKLERSDNCFVSDVMLVAAEIERKNAQKRAEDRKAKDRNRIKAAIERLPEVRDALAAQPHPKFDGSTLLAYVEWMLRNASHKGRLDAAKIIEKNLP